MDGKLKVRIQVFPSLALYATMIPGMARHGLLVDRYFCCTVFQQCKFCCSSEIDQLNLFVLQLQVGDTFADFHEFEERMKQFQVRINHIYNVFN